ncbi:MAG: Gx transporter family protein [Elusimicrobiota bacterium]|nr:Gx transporter family protein [Elusimicrobiota bacterium]
MPAHSKNRVYLALFIAAASVLQIIEWMVPNPLPGIKLGLANMVTLLALILYGAKFSLGVAVGRTLFSSLIIGAFLSPTFILSFSGALFSALTMVVLYRPLGKLSPVGVSICGAVVHNLVQVFIVYYLLVKHPGIIFLLPLLLAAAVITGSLNGYLAKIIAPRVAEFASRRIFLASISPRRREMLKKEGLPVIFIDPGEAEQPPAAGEDPRNYALRQAENKVELVFARVNPPGAVLSGDTVVSSGGEIFLKPGSKEKARKMLNRLNGRRQKVITAVVLKELQSGKVYKNVVTTELKMKEFSQREIAELSRSHYDKAGGYAIQGLKDSHIEYIRGSYSNVVGFPRRAVREILKKSGV